MVWYFPWVLVLYLDVMPFQTNNMERKKKRLGGNLFYLSTLCGFLHRILDALPMIAAAELKILQARAKRQKLENQFLFIWKAINGPELQREFRAIPDRGFRLDFADPVISLGIEVEGGQWCGGRHTHGSGFQDDCAKYLEHALRGWVIIRLTDNMITKAVLERIATYIRIVHAASDKILGT